MRGFIKDFKVRATVITLLTIIGISIWGSLSVNAAGKHNDTTVNKYYTSITVEADDTLWDIADAYINSNLNNNQTNIYCNDYTLYISEIKQINNMSSDTIYAGQNLIVYYYAP